MGERWSHRRLRRGLAWYGARFRRLPARGPAVALFCDFEGHHAGSDGEYYAEQGLDRLLDITNRHRLNMTFNVVADLCRSHPHRLARIREVGHEVACHGWRHECPRDSSRNELSAMLIEAINCFAEVGCRPEGFRSPQSAWSLDLVRCLPEHGFHWNAERDSACRPYYIRRGLVRVPVLIDDWPVADHSMDAGRLLKEWDRRLEPLLNANGAVGIGVHDWILGREPDFADALDEWIGQVRTAERFELTTLGALASHDHLN